MIDNTTKFGTQDTQSLRNKSMKTKLTHKNWSEVEDKFLSDNLSKMTHAEIARALNRTEKSISTRIATQGYKKCAAKIGDEILCWKIIEIFTCPKTNKTMAKIHSTVGDQKERTVRLTKLVNQEIKPPAGYRKKEPDQLGPAQEDHSFMCDFL